MGIIRQLKLLDDLEKNKLIIMNDLLEKVLNRCINYTEVNLGCIPEVFEIKKEVSRLKDMRFIIYSNDHNPPHFHIKSRDGSINAKFTIDECEYISGEIKNKDIKRVKLFFKNIHEDSKLKEEWNRRCNNL